MLRRRGRPSHQPAASASKLLHPPRAHKIMPMLKVTQLAREYSANARDWDLFKGSGKKITVSGKIALTRSSKAVAVPPGMESPSPFRSAQATFRLAEHLKAIRQGQSKSETRGPIS